MTLLGQSRSSEPALLVLISLLEGPRHGYAITEDIERLTGRRPGPGTLYGAISRLEDAGLIEPQPVEPLAHMLLGALSEAGLVIAGADDARAARDAVGVSLDRLLRGLRSAGA